MTRTLKDIRFDGVAPRIDNVVVAVVPVDAFSGRIVTSGIRVELLDPNNNNRVLLFKPVRNLSGMYVFVNLEPALRYRIQVRATEHFDPPPIDYIPPAPTDPDVATKRRLEVMLFRRPTFAADAQGTVVAGTLKRGTQPVANGVVTAQLDPILAPGANPFETRSDDSGNFAVPLRLPQEASTDPVLASFRFSDNFVARQLDRLVQEDAFYSFETPVDLAATSVTNDPALVKFGG